MMTLPTGFQEMRTAFKTPKKIFEEAEAVKQGLMFTCKKCEDFLPSDLDAGNGVCNDCEEDETLLELI